MDDFRRRPLPDDLEGRRWAIDRGFVPDRDRPDGGVLLRDAERLAEPRLVEDAEEHRAEPRVDRGLQDEQSGHTDVDVPIRHGPPLRIAIQSPLVREAVATLVGALA